ncbi:type II toxin-antitoxin system HicB family antitoxin [Halobacterium sp. BOL4-2]|uniref:type II toxin-antitoxin system HicB family antitoxin n=1 Tax=Halobacterium sp. BOL4-2 TaxID=2810537 RepID=UPI001964F23B|nr:type II toxin-antitoxin system HicB family antitoxin [Halobacterium sp. BOL4-2]QRY24869.1 type II toxin-antitoxin system HicB family antitoxin [Halobacterium sp. BOL4-2]
MATKANRDDGRRDIRLTRNPDGQWTARDLIHDLSVQGATRNAALDALDDVVAAVHGDGGHEPTDAELHELGVDTDVARSQREDLPDVLE